MELITRAVLALALTAGMLAGLAGPAAAQGSSLALQVGELGPLIELIVELFEIDIRIRG